MISSMGQLKSVYQQQSYHHNSKSYFEGFLDEIIGNDRFIHLKLDNNRQILLNKIQDLQHATNYRLNDQHALTKLLKEFQHLYQ